MENRIIIAGGRDFKDYFRLWYLCKHYLKKVPKNTIEIISGGATGADKLGERFAKEEELPLTIFKADWDKFGKSAGYLRNKEMSEYATHLIAFWDGHSKGTKHMIDLAREKGLKIRVIKY